MALYVFWIVKYLLNKVDTIAMLFMNWECDVSEVLHQDIVKKLDIKERNFVKNKIDNLSNRSTN